MNDPVEISRALLDATRSRSSEGDELRARLAGVDVLALTPDDARIAFWLNLYNALVLAELAREARRGSLLRHRSLFAADVARIGDHDYSLDLIEHGVLRRNARPPYRLRPLLGPRDPRRAAAPSAVDPRVHFALNCGAVSCPPIAAYSAAGLDRELEATTGRYIRAETRLDRAADELELPYLLRLYRSDFGGRTEASAYAAAYLDQADAAWVRERKPKISFTRFDWTLANG